MSSKENETVLLKPEHVEDEEMSEMFAWIDLEHAVSQFEKNVPSGEKAQKDLDNAIARLMRVRAAAARKPF